MTPNAAYLFEQGWEVVQTPTGMRLTDPAGHAAVDLNTAWSIQKSWEYRTRGTNPTIDRPAVRTGLAIQLLWNRRLWHRSLNCGATPASDTAIFHLKNTIARHTAEEINDALKENHA